MKATDTAIAELAAMDPPLEELVRRYHKYVSVTDAIIRTRPRESDQYAVASLIGRERLDELLVKRLRALGLGPMLKRARTQGTLEATLLETLGSTIGDVRDRA